jgi:phage recombination protein Bet
MSATTTKETPPEKALALPDPVIRRGITEPQWRTLVNNLYPGAHLNSVLMVWDYCVARKLDPLKKPCHIVPMEVKDAKTGAYSWRDVVMPGIYEHRTTAQRTGLYLGHSKPDYGPIVNYMGVDAPAWCAMTVYRWNAQANMRAEFPVEVLFAECCAVTKDRKTQEWKANARWSKAPVQMLTKCTEAAGLREAFPDEIGGEQTAEEMDGQRAIDVQVIDEKPPALPKPDGYDDWLDDLRAVAEEGLEKLDAAWQASSQEYRAYLTTTNGEYWESLRGRATEVGA